MQIITQKKGLPRKGKLEYNKTLSSALSYAKENKIDREGKAKNCFRNFYNATILVRSKCLWNFFIAAQALKKI